MRIRPAFPGAVIRDPQTKRPLPEEGADVAESSYWLRRLRSGDVVRVDEPTGLEPVTPLTTREP
jgi:hypothetical protein